MGLSVGVDVVFVGAGVGDIVEGATVGEPVHFTFLVVPTQNPVCIKSDGRLFFRLK